MGWSRNDEDFRADHDRDLQKHDMRSAEPLPHRLDVPISTATDIALIVRGLKNVPDAAALIERYADGKVSAERNRVIDALNGKVSA